MLQWTNTTATAPSGGTTYTSNPSVLVGGGASPYCFLFCATARSNETQALPGSGGTKYDLASRTATSCYMVGLKEAIDVQVSNGVPWQWRRICFTYKGGSTLANHITGPSDSFAPAVETTSGYTRVVNSLGVADQTSFFSLLFSGAQAVDWIDPFAAKVDNKRVSLKYDKTYTVTSNNEEGVIRKYNRWHQMRHNIEYDDDESGGTMQANEYSVESKVGMGDYWVLDLIRPRSGTTSADQMSINFESTLYWHER